MGLGDTMQMALACGRVLEDSIYYAPMIAVVCGVIATVIMIARVIFIPVATTRDIQRGEIVAHLHEQGAVAQEYRLCNHPDEDIEWLEAIQARIKAEEIEKVDAVLMQITLASVGSCTCSTKSPEPHYHMVGCRYRALAEAHDLIAKAYGRTLWPFPVAPEDGQPLYQQGGEPPIVTS